MVQDSDSDTRAHVVFNHHTIPNHLLQQMLAELKVPARVKPFMNRTRCSHAQHSMKQSCCQRSSQLSCSLLLPIREPNGIKKIHFCLLQGVVLPSKTDCCYLSVGTGRRTAAQVSFLFDIVQQLLLRTQLIKFLFHNKVTEVNKYPKGLAHGGLWLKLF